MGKKTEQFTLSVDVENDLQDQFNEDYENVLKSVIVKVTELKLQDKELCLHSLAPNKIKENIQ